MQTMLVLGHLKKIKVAIFLSERSNDEDVLTFQINKINQ